MTYTIAGDDGATARRYGLRGIPTLVVIDRAGRIRDVLVGLDPSTRPRLERTLGELLVET